MAGIKNINVISGTGNPVQMQDLQNLWSAINSLLRSTKTPISIVAGFATANNNTGTNIGEGIICYQGQAYYLAADVAKIGQYLYANTIQDEQRVYEDGTTRYTYQDYVVNAAANASASGIGTLIGQATAANLAAWKVGVLSDGSVTAAMLADGAVTTPKLANSAVTTAKIAYGSITAGKIEAETITNEEIANKTIVANQKLESYSIEEAQYGTSSVSARALQANSVNTSIIKDGAVTGSKIAAKTITNEEIANATIDADQKIMPNTIGSALYATASISSRALQTNSVNTPAIMNKAITLEKLADKISVLLPNTVTSITHNISPSPIYFPEGTIGTLNIPTSPPNHAIAVYLVQSSSGLLVHHWTMLVFKNDVGPFQITFSGESIGTRRFDLPQYAINCILDIYFYPPYGLVVGAAQPNFIVK